MSNLVKLVSKPIDYIYIYNRVSTGKQSSDKKLGLSTQKDLCGKYITKFYPDNQNILNFYDIGSSYKTQKILIGMKDLICKLKQNSLILISETSRLGRSKKMVEQILKIVKKKKSFIVSISENLVFGKTKLNDKFFIQKIIDAEKESDTLSLRIKNTHTYIKKNGGYIGKAPFGYSIKKNHRNIPVLKENPQDFMLIDKIVNLSNECLSYSEIKDIMNNQNILNNNKKWTTSKVKNILNKFYPEHMSLDIQNKSEKITIIENEEDIVIQSNKVQNTIKDRVKDSICGQLKITISNERRNVYYSPISSSSIRLRSGREINRF